MSTANVIKISAESLASFDDAIREGIKAASRTVRNIRGAWVKEQVVIDNADSTRFSVELKVTFVME